jgi:hypothetical protein
MADYGQKDGSEQLRDVPATRLSGHDEPVVVDNGPATVVFGKKHTVTSNDGMTWTREDADNFFALYVQEEAANGEVTFVDSWDLAKSGKEISRVRVTLEDGEGFDYTLVSAGANQNLQMESAKTKLDRDMGTGRLKFNGGKQVVVKLVEGFKSGVTNPLITYTPQTNPKHVKVVILLKPEKPTK